MFVCLACGQCCLFKKGTKNDFTVWEWEIPYLQNEALKLGHILDIRPESGYISGNRVIAINYNWYMHGACSFLDEHNKCVINEKKPLMCAMYPYEDELMSMSRTWRCIREINEHTGRTRKMWYANPLKRLPMNMAYSALIYRRFLRGDGQIEFSFTSGDIRNINLSKFPACPNKIFVKSLYGELSKKGLIDSRFLNILNSFKWSKIEQCYKELNQIPHVHIKLPPIIKEIFNLWSSPKDETPEFQSPISRLPEKGWQRGAIPNPPHLFPIDHSIEKILENNGHNGMTEEEILRLLGRKGIQQMIRISDALWRLHYNSRVELWNKDKVKWRYVDENS